MRYNLHCKPVKKKNKYIYFFTKLAQKPNSLILSFQHHVHDIQASSFNIYTQVIHSNITSYIIY